MGRRSRIHYPGAVYHAMARGVDGRTTFIDDVDYRKFLMLMNRVKAQANAVIYAYCLMPNHFHLAIKVSSVRLGSIVQRILTGYVKTFNPRHERTGHLFQARHQAIPCLTNRYLLNLIRYIQMNPVRAGLVNDPLEWPWSSRAPMALPDLDEGFDPWPGISESASLVRPAIRRISTLEEIGAKISECTGVELGSLRSPSKCRSLIGAKVRFAQESVILGYSLKDIAIWLHCESQAVSYYLRKNSTNSLA